MHKINFAIYNRINVILDIFRIGSNDRAVVMVVSVLQIHCARKECLDRKYVVTPCVDQPLYMSVSQFCRITFGLTWNGLNTEFINASV